MCLRIEQNNMVKKVLAQYIILKAMKKVNTRVTSITPPEDYTHNNSNSEKVQ